PVPPALARAAQRGAAAGVRRRPPGGPALDHRALPGGRGPLLGEGVLSVRLLLITNPAAARTQPHVLQGIVDVLRTGGWQAEVAATGGPGDARRLAAEGVAEG